MADYEQPVNNSVTTIEDLNEGISARLDKSANLFDLPDKVTSRSNLGLGSSATYNTEDLPVSDATAASIAATVSGHEAAINGLVGPLMEAITDEIQARITGDEALQSNEYFAGGWDASTGSFPLVRDDLGAVRNGDFFVVTVGGTVDGVTFQADDRIRALKNIPSAVTISGNWMVTPLSPLLVPIVSRLDDLDIEVAQAITANREDFIVSVGMFGDFDTINDALSYMSGYHQTFVQAGRSAVIMLRPDFVMEEQVFVSGGIDLSWITIKASDSSVLINHSKITRSGPVLDGGNPVFYATGGAKLPTIGCLFYYASNSTAKDGVFCYNGHVEILPECGIRKCRDGIRCYHGSTITCTIDGLRSQNGINTSERGVDFRSCKGRALDVQYGGIAQLPRSSFQDCEGAVSVYVIWGNSFAGLYQSDISNSAGEAVLSRDSGRADCRQCDVSGSLRGFHAIHGGYINARSKSGDITWTKGGASNCTEYAVMCTNGSLIECPELNCDDCGFRAIHSDAGSTVNAQLATARRAGSVALNCTLGSVINADQIDASGSKKGIICSSAGRVNADLSDFSNTYDLAVYANGASSVSINSSNLSGCSGEHAIKSISSFVSAFEVDASSCTGIAAILSLEGGEVTAVGSNVSGASGNGFSATRGGKIVAEGADATGTGGFGYEVGKGSTIVATGSATGTLSQTANTLTASGVIFQ